MHSYGFHVTAVILSTAAVLSVPPSGNREQPHAQQFASTPSAPETAVSQPDDVPPAQAGATASEPAVGLQPDPRPQEQLAFVADPGVKSAPPEVLPPPSPSAPSQGRSLNEVDQYLWGVYERSRTKADAHGDFTWKDVAAAGRMGLDPEKYVIGGMDRDFRELLFHLGHALDAAGIDWTILSGFRDDYRQSIAAGFKAHDENSFHGGSIATGGYGHGCAVDIASANGAASNPILWQWLDQFGERFAVHRPMPQIDPAHLQPFGSWHQVAAAFRRERIANGRARLSSDASADDLDDLIAPESASSSGVSESQFMCVRPHPVEVANRQGFLTRVAAHAKQLAVRTAALYTDRTRRNTKSRIASEGRPEQRRRAENLGHHIRSKPRVHVAQRDVLKHG